MDPDADVRIPEMKVSIQKEITKVSHKICVFKKRAFDPVDCLKSNWTSITSCYVGLGAHSSTDGCW